MRIKIKGLITAERLATALDAASVKFGDNFGGFYGANLYINCFTPSGLPIEIGDHDGKEVAICFGVPDGELEKPILTKDGAISRANQKKEAEEAENNRDAERKKMNEENSRHWNEQRRIREELDNIVQVLNTISLKALETRPASFTEDLNAVIRTVWDELKPVYPNGNEKGLPRPMPWFQFDKKALLLHRDSTGVHFKKVKNPVYPKSGCRNDFDHHWSNPAWLEVEKRLYCLMVKEQEVLQNNEPVSEANGGDLDSDMEEFIATLHAS